ncbi:MAG: sulfur transferase domain-containing protein [Pseudomonadota bacterium]
MTNFVTHQFYPQSSSENPLEGPVKSRQVIYIQGFFPKGMDYYHKILGAELGVYADLYGLQATLSPLARQADFVGRCRIEVKRDGQSVVTDYDFLEWNDLIIESQHKNICETGFSSIKTFFVHIIDGSAAFMARTFWKYFLAWFLPYLLFAVAGFVLVKFLLAGAMLFTAAGAIVPLKKICLYLLGLFVLWKLNRLYWSSLMLRNFNAAAAFAKGHLPQLEKRIAVFADYIADVCRNSKADEILIVGHSFGTQIAAVAVAKASRSGAFDGLQGRAKLLTLGDATCHIGSLQGSGAKQLRHDVLHLASQDKLPWLLLYNSKDVLGFNTTDPPSALAALESKKRDVEDFRWPLMLDARFRDMVPRKDYEWLRWKFFHMHSQFIFAARLKNARYDYLRAVCGAQTLPLGAQRLSQKSKMAIARKKRQQLRADRIDAATQRWAEPIRSTGRRFRAWSSLLLADHGFLRPVYWNSAEIGAGAWRGPQPNPFHLRRLARQGLKTIVNLRGNTVYGSYALEKEAAEKLSLKLIDFQLYSGAAPHKEQIHALQKIFREAEKPMLLHCKSGADRSGLAAVLYLVLEENVPVKDALRELSFKYGHVKSGRTGILDLFFENYLRDNKKTPMPFMQWVDEVYDRQKLNSEFSKPTLLRTIVDLVIRRE